MMMHGLRNPKFSGVLAFAVRGKILFLKILSSESNLASYEMKEFIPTMYEIVL
jgi:hypothetical protein